jgi:hypothetical protein
MGAPTVVAGEALRSGATGAPASSSFHAALIACGEKSCPRVDGTYISDSEAIWKMSAL